MHVCQSVIAPRMTICQAGVIEPELIQNCRLQIVDGNVILATSVAHLVARAIDESALESAACNP